MFFKLLDYYVIFIQIWLKYFLPENITKLFSFVHLLVQFLICSSAGAVILYKIQNIYMCYAEKTVHKIYIFK